MDPGLQKQMLKMSGDSFAILEQLREMFQEQARTERFKAVKGLMFTKMSAGESVSRHVLKMKGQFEHLESLGVEYTNELKVYMILATLPSQFDGFIMNFNMHKMDKTITELHGMLITAEVSLQKKPKDVLMVHKGGISFKKASGSKVNSSTPTGRSEEHTSELQSRI